LVYVVEVVGTIFGYEMDMTGEVRQRSARMPLLYGSAAVHLAAAAVTLARPRLWPWTLGMVVLDHLLITAASLWPRSDWLGPNWTRLPAQSAARGEIAITIDDGPDPEVTPRVLEVLATFEARASFFCVGERVSRYPDIAREIVRRGHSVENHSQRHRHSFSLLGPRGMAAEIEAAQQSIARVTGQSPRFFRAPAGLRNPFLDPILERLQLQLASWTRRGFDTVNADPDDVYRRLERSLAGGDILLLHDGHAARARAGTPVILEVLPRLLETLNRRQLRPVTLPAAVP
jgi:peptidoglycan/xylan/chitin deacetylase (PgdA/CDA1 family)